MTEWRPPANYPGGRLFVLAGSHVEFTVWCHRNRLNPRSRHLAPLSRLEQLQGLRGVSEQPRFIVTPGFNSLRPRVREQIWAALEHRHAVRVWEGELW